ncbi:MAG: hypothetical protein Q8M03_09260 [Legionella sp.]|nr:hypothetical protein [Legionella sp.]
MAADKAVTAAVWAKAKRLYADPEMKLSAIAAMVGLAPIQLSLAAKARGWPPRTALAAKRKRAAPVASSSKAASTEQARVAARHSANGGKPSKSAKPMVLVQRVYNTIDGELTKLEKQKGASSQDRERASRALSQMVSSLEKAVEMQREMTKAAAKGSGVKDKEALAHAEDLRRAIAERLERLQRQRALGKRSE